MKYPTLYSGAAILAICLPALISHASVVIQDTFTSRYSPESSVTLTGTHPDSEGESLTWTANNNLVFKSANGIEYLTADGTANHAAMTLPFSYDLYSNQGSVATVGITLSSTTGTNKWIGVGFSSSPTSFNPTNNGTIWLQINRTANTPQWYLKTRNTTLVSGSLGAIDLSASNTFSFSYDFETHTVTGIYLNGVNVLTEQYVFGVGDNVPIPGTTKGAGAFFQWADNNINKVTDFSVSVTPSIPEPANWALIGGILFLTSGMIARFTKRL